MNITQLNENYCLTGKYVITHAGKQCGNGAELIHMVNWK